jgi:hypothetical protein
VEVGKPTNDGNYNLVNIDGINIYVSKDCRLANDSIEIKLRGFWVFQSLEVIGIKPY